MIQSRLKFSIILPLIAAALALSAFQCSKDQKHQAAQTAASLATALQAFEEANEELYAQKLVAAQETIAISQAVANASRANDQFVANVRALNGVDAHNKAQLVAYFQQLADSINALNEQSVLYVKNPQAQQRLRFAYQAIDAALEAVKEFVSLVPDTPHDNAKSLAGGPSRGFPLLAAVVINEEMLLQLLMLALRLFGIGSQVVKAIKEESGLSDDQLLSLAEKKDAETRELVQKHIDEVKQQVSGVTTPLPGERV
jgi:hypothetical protein